MAKKRCCSRCSGKWWRAIQARCWCWRRGILSASSRSLRCWRRPGLRYQRRSQWDGQTPDRRGHFPARQHWRAGQPVRVCRSGVHRREPGAARRTQRAGSGAVRSADSGRAAHRELPRHHRSIPQSRCAARGYSAVVELRPCCNCWRTMRQRAALGRRAAEVHALAARRNRADRQRAAGAAA